jgi:extracellular factor (EF) 3-hydroxypalmitic acid methyl ester biosynthesis protein
MSTATGDHKDSLVVCQTHQGVEIRAALLRLTRYLAVFEVYSANQVIQTSEVLQDFHVILLGRTVYAGRAVVNNLVNTGTLVVVEAKLDESAFTVPSLEPGETGGFQRDGFSDFLRQWQGAYKVRPEFKVVVADMQTFLMDLRLWLEQVELEIRSAPAANRLELERQAALEIGDSVVPAFDAMHERLEHLSRDIEVELRPVYQNFAYRQLHSLVMCSPFAYRTYHKPLGYAGDYEMVNMIVRDPYEGASLFAKVVNLWFLSQWPARAHRNRIQYLKELLTQEALRGAREGRVIRVLNLGCGPAREVQEFIAENSLCERAQFTLLDFNEETIRHTSGVLEQCKRRYGRSTLIQIQKKSVQHILKERSKLVVEGPEKKYDVIYCAGLFDYLPDCTCRQLMNIFYDWLVPGGLIAATNVDDCKPFRHMLEFVLDWNLIYRSQKKGLALVPDRVAPDDICSRRDPTAVNLFIEVRKAGHG